MLVLVALTSAVSMMVPTSFLKGLVIGSFFVGGGAALWSLTVQVTGTAPVMMGDTAEMWTAMELRRLQSRGWRVVNHFLLARDDLDHVLVGPGGAYVVETKWSASPWQSEFGRSRVRAAVAQANANARSLGLWHPMKSRGVPVRPVVVLWGGGPNRQESIARDQGTTIVTGNALRTWVDRLDGEALSADQVADVWQALDAQVALRDPSDRAENPVPTSVAALLSRCSIAISCAVLGFFLVGRLLAATDSVWLSVGLGAATLVPAVVGTRVRRLRVAAWGWLIGIGLPVLALALAQLLSQL
ncbi:MULTISPECIES: nuclease-related domain-containing protein [Nocardioides]|uniref:Nuclease-related domain-containing protein n=1 Tax=Nocardioides vastitatis TaxID=2568655 RepID=A0ABW0ZKX2_9ACTN|nr:nuclease-related domain-containing protein [Nocardioides sp.]